MRAVLLGRVSTKKAAQTTSLKRQRDELEDLALRKAWSVAGWFEDRSSGGNFDRPGLRAALDAVFRGGADVLVVHDLDRLGRNAKEMLGTVDALAAAGKGLYVRDRSIDATGAYGRLVFTIFAAVAEFYSSQASEKIIHGLEHARARGRVGGRRRRLDYGRLERARELRASGVSWSKVASELGGGAGAWSRAVGRESGRS